MHSLRRAVALAVALAEAASAPHRSARLYSASRSKRQSAATASKSGAAAASKSGAAAASESATAAAAATRRTRTTSTPPEEADENTKSTSTPPEEAEEDTKSSWVTPTLAPSGIEKLAAEPLKEAEAVSWRGPSEIPFQAKVANSVSLIGRIRMPVQIQATLDGKSSADQTSDSPSFWIPITFEGDLAHLAASHLKEKALVSMEGQLSGALPALGESPGQTNIQVIVSSISFEELTTDFQKYEKPGTVKQDYLVTATKQDDSVTIKQDTIMKLEDYWKDLLLNPGDWSDHRKAKLDGSVNEKFPDFKRKDKTAALWLDTASIWVLSSIEGLEFGGDDAWKDLVENPDNWWDNRLNKPKSTYPDFKHRETGQALWLDSSPSWVLSKLRPPPKLQQDEEATGSNMTAVEERSVEGKGSAS